MQAIRVSSSIGWLRQWLFNQVLPSLQRPAVPLPASRWRTLHITVASAQAASLRRLVMQACGEGVRCMHMQPLDHARRLRLCLRLPAPAALGLMEAVMAALPQAEFSLWQRG